MRAAASFAEIFMFNCVGKSRLNDRLLKPSSRLPHSFLQISRKTKLRVRYCIYDSLVLLCNIVAVINCCKKKKEERKINYILRQPWLWAVSLEINNDVYRNGKIIIYTEHAALNRYFIYLFFTIHPTVFQLHFSLLYIYSLLFQPSSLTLVLNI